MSEFSIKDAALTGFRFARENPITIPVWAVVILVSTFLSQWIVISMAGEAMGQMQAMQSDPESADPTAVFGLMGQMMTAGLVALVPALIATSLIFAAAIRGTLRPGSHGLGYLRLGADELRVMVVLLVVGVILGIVYFVGSTIGGIIAVVMAMSAGAAPTPEAMSSSMIAVMFPVLVITGLIMLYIYGRFSLATPLTLDRKAINIFSSVALTKGRGGRVYRTYLLAALLYLAVFFLGGAIFLGVAAAMTGDLADLQAFVMQPDMTSLEAFLTPLRIVYMLIMSVIGALGAAIMLTPAATIYQALTEEGVDEVF